MLASGQHIMHYIRMSGRIQIDLLGYFRRSDSLSSYSLDSVAGYCIGDGIHGFKWYEENTHFETSNMTGLAVNAYVHVEEIGHTTEYYAGGAKFRVLSIDDTGFTVAGTVKPNLTSKKARWCLAKDDVTPKDLFRLCGGTADDRAIVAKYCIQDCNLVQMLLHKRDVITGYVEMAKICSVPIGFLVLRGQGIKLTSYIAKKCRERNTLMPVINKGSMSDGYEGAEVLTPKRGFYLDNPVACLDYASLYPSAMMSENFCHSSKVWTKQYDLSGNLVKETGERGANGAFIFDELDAYTYVDVTYDTYKYVFTRPGIAPKKVLSGHKCCRFAQYPDGERAIMPAILEDLLKARKATRRILKDEQDEFMQSVLEQRQLGYKLTANSLYGQCGAKTSTFYEIDIAACTTATGQKLLNYGKRIVEECYGDAACETANHGTVLTKAEYIYGDSVAKWTPVYVSMTPKGGGSRVVDIVPIEELADRYGQPSGWLSGHHEKEVCEMIPGVETWTETGWTRLECVIRHELAQTKRMLRVNTPTGLVDVTDDHSLLLQTGEEVSPISVCKALDAGMHIALMHAPPPRRQCTAAWWRDDPVRLQRYYGYECRFNQFGEWLRIILGRSVIYKFNGRVTLEERQQTLVAVIYYTAREKFGFDATIHIEPSVVHVQYERQTTRYIVITINDMTYDPCINNHIDITEIPYSGPVYDLTTANHHFAAGVGQLIVHNTDSVFFTFNLHNMDGEPIRGKDALEITIELAQEAGHLASKFLKPPHDFEYEKTFMPFLLLSKKRYVGMLYELNHERPEKRKEMGIVLKRRDSAPCVKDSYGEIIDTLMGDQPNNFQLALAALRRELQAMVDGRCPMSKLIISKSLRSGYKNPRAIAHAVLANRITEREPGNKPTSGDRIQYVYFIPPKAVKLQGDRIETPQFIIDNNLPIDYAHYVSNQIMKPVSQIFERLIEDIIGRDKPRAIAIFNRELAAAIAAGTEDKFRSKKVEELLFQPYLRELANKKNGNKPLTAFFTQAK
jgi:DNA polymerase elongation subunit (family B)